ncbi:hypothetical protein K8354_07085 [Polaribacter litorisediminis]|uniref:hypothetical protein n=1 Tax=Polaribacter litorisediminis TaxID=1908341 RepID=UPI001CC1A407|nr:hypothetical protein [Polaribacter litorisediminis]UAM99562.1 hypothetical protein K8354_07085 [Polaribacter litorisediminis]
MEIKTLKIKHKTSFHLVDFINRKIEADKHNEIGVPILLIMYNTGIASLTAGLSLYINISYIILAISIITAMSALVAVLNLMKFKFIVWFCLISISINIILLIYQIIILQ